MFAVTEADAAAIRAAWESSGELGAAVELRRRFAGIESNAKATECARIIAGWTPRAGPPPEPARVVPLRRPSVRG